MPFIWVLNKALISLLIVIFFVSSFWLHDKEQTSFDIEDSSSFESDQIILTSFFTKKKNAHEYQFDIPKDNFDFIQQFYESVQSHQFQTVIFHDDCSEEFVQNYSTPLITFVEVDTEGLLSTNDIRFILYERWLSQHRSKYVLMVDIRDVVFGRNPFDFMEEKANEFDIFLGVDKKEKLGEIPFQEKKLHTCYKHDLNVRNLNVKGWKMVNAGVIGGKYDAVTTLLKGVCSDLLYYAPRIEKDADCNMQVVVRNTNKILNSSDNGIYNGIPWRLWTGVPFTNQFLERNDPKKGEYYVYHKYKGCCQIHFRKDIK